MRRLMILGFAVAMLAAACGSDDTGSEGSTAAPTPSDEEEPAQEDDGQGPDSAVAGGWDLTVISEGTKPILALDADGLPAVAFLFEDIPEGFVGYASSTDGWAVDLLVEGYFYGPIGLDFDQDNRPNIAYHDHQADSFDQQLGDLTHAVRDGADWQFAAAASDGHDGWDSTLRIGPDGTVRAAGVDPAQFGRNEGIEYYELVDGEWTVEAIGSGPIEYEWNVDLQVAADGTVAMTYFATGTADLIFASRTPDGGWTLETVVADGDVGRFSSFAFDADSVAHISYWNADTSEVTYATNAGGAWETSPIAGLAAVEIGFEGARRITALALDPDGSPVVAYSDTAGVWLARPDAGGVWQTEQVVTAGGRPLGQLVTLVVDGIGTPHLAYFEVTGNGPLSGEIVYVTTAG